MNEPKREPKREPNHWWSVADVARAAQVDVRTVHQWRRRRCIPAPDRIVFGNRPQWRQQRIIGWMDSTGRLPLESSHNDDELMLL